MMVCPGLFRCVHMKVRASFTHTSVCFHFNKIDVFGVKIDYYLTINFCDNTTIQMQKISQ